MADTTKHFETDLPARLASDSDFADSINNVFRLEKLKVLEHGTSIMGVVAEGEHDDPECVVTSDKETFDEVLDDPSIAMGKFMVRLVLPISVLRCSFSNFGISTQHLCCDTSQQIKKTS